MLVIRMQRTGRKGHAMFRVVVQDSRLTPTSGKVVAQLGSYDPHAKTIRLDKEKAAFYLDNGAQPSDRVVRILKAEDVKLPGWVKEPTERQRAVRNADKRRSTSPPAPAEESAPAEEPAANDETSNSETEVASATDAEETTAPSSEQTEASTEESAPETKAPEEDKPAEEAASETEKTA